MSDWVASKAGDKTEIARKMRKRFAPNQQFEFQAGLRWQGQEIILRGIIGGAPHPTAWRGNVAALTGPTSSQFLHPYTRTVSSTLQYTRCSKNCVWREFTRIRFPMSANLAIKRAGLHNSSALPINH